MAKIGKEKLSEKEKQKMTAVAQAVSKKASGKVSSGKAVNTKSIANSMATGVVRGGIGSMAKNASPKKTATKSGASKSATKKASDLVLRLPKGTSVQEHQKSQIKKLPYDPSKPSKMERYTNKSSASKSGSSIARGAITSGVGSAARNTLSKSKTTTKKKEYSPYGR